MKSMQLVFGKSESFYILTNEMESCFLRLITIKNGKEITWKKTRGGLFTSQVIAKQIYH